MAKIILEFDAHEDQLEANDAINGSKWKSLVWDFDQILRDTTKYGKSVMDQQEASEGEMEIADKYRILLRDMMYDSGLKFD